MTKPKFKIGDKVFLIDTSELYEIKDICIINPISYTIFQPRWTISNVSEARLRPIHKTHIKPEFKVDKLGWYKTQNFGKCKIIYKHNDNTFIGFDHVNIDRPCMYTANGECHTFFDESWRLVEYIGPELPKEPRKFELEGRICDLDNGRTDGVTPYIIPTKMHVSKFYGKHHSKWYIQMTEILED